MGDVGTTYVYNIIRTHIYVHRRYRGAGDGALVEASSGAGFWMRKRRRSRMTVMRRRSHRWRRRRRRRRTYISNSQRAGPPDGNAIKFSRFLYAERNRRAPSQRHFAPSLNYAPGRYPPSSPVILLSRYTLRLPPLSRTVPTAAHPSVTHRRSPLRWRPWRVPPPRPLQFHLFSHWRPTSD